MFFTATSTSRARFRSTRTRRRSRVLTLELLEGRVVPSTITVTSLADSGSGTLRTAITQADQDTTPDTINFDPSVVGTITLESALPDLAGNITLDGPGASLLTVARSGATGTPDFRIFTIASGAVATIEGLTASGGQVISPDVGGGIENSGTLTVMNAEISGNSAGFLHNADFSTGGIGGGISNSGTLTLTDSTLNSNLATSIGGAIDNESTGTMTLAGCTFNGNEASVYATLGLNTFGGAIYNEGAVTLADTTFAGNSAASGGGGIYNKGTMTGTGATFTYNSGNSGGAIENVGALELTTSALDTNSGNVGAGIYVGAASTLTLTGCTLNGNGNYYDGLTTYSSFGGGIDNDGVVTIIDSSLSDNFATTNNSFSAGGDGGGIYNTGTLTVDNSTLSGNSASSEGTGGYTTGILGGGGGVYNTGTATLTDSTVEGSTAVLGGGIYNEGPR